jgi:hypothetical protein
MSIEDYNSTIQSIPTLFIVGMFPKQLKFNFIRWELSKEKIQTSEERVVQF